MIEMPDVPSAPCCMGPDACCVCSPSERALRAWGWGGFVEPMTEAQRGWCLDQITKVEGYERRHYEGLGDAAMARACFSAWTDFCQDKGLM